MKKRFLAMLLALTMCLALLPTAALAADSDFTIENGVLTKYNGSGGAVVIPDGVTSIGKSAFSSCKNLTGITIPDSVTNIGNNAFFNCSGLTRVTIPGGVTSIDDRAFEGCKSLTSVTIFNGVTSIGRWVFASCAGLTSVTIPTSVTSIGQGAFSYCTALTGIQVEVGNQNYTAVDGVLFTKDRKTLMACPAGKCGEYIIPSDTTSIKGSAFAGCSGLTSVTIPNSVTSIDYGVFTGCTGLTNITIPNSAASIGNSAFSSCTGLTSVTIPDSITKIGSWAFDGCTALSDVYYNGMEAQWSAISIDANNAPLVSATIHYGATVSAPNSDFTIENGVLTKYNGSGGAVVIPDGVTSIGDSAFQNNTSITSVFIPNGVTNIGKYAFQNCSNLASVTFPNSLTAIRERAFYCCASLTGITLPSGLQRIESCAFFDCIALKTLVIPNSVAHLGERSFQGCKNMTKVTFEPGGVDLTLAHGTFAHCTSLAEMNLSDRITIIGGVDEGYPGSGYVFVNSPELHSIVIPESVEQINLHCFEDCTGLTSITLLNPTTQIGDCVFLNTNLQDVYYAGTEAMWNEMSIGWLGNDKLLNANIHYNSTGPVPDVPEMVVPDLGDASIQESVIQKGSEAVDWADRVKLPEYAEELYDTISGSQEKSSVFEEEKNFTLPQASTGPAVSKVDKIEAAEFSLLDLYANPGAELDSAIFSNESFYDIPANAEDQKIDFSKLTIGDLVTTANYNGVFVTKIPYDSTFDAKKTETCEYIAAVYHAFDRDHPEIFWLSGKCKARVMVATDPATNVKQAYFFLVLADKDGFSMRAPAWTAEGSIAAGVARRDAAVAEILKSVTASDPGDQVKQLNKWLTEHNQYNTTENLTPISNEPHECLAALEGKIGTDGPVCDGYARAFKVLCDKLGVPCILETGWARPTAASSAEFHMWNLVQIGSAWYGADITWDDPSVKDFIGAKSGRENEDFLLVGADTVINGLTFSQSHVVKNQAAVGGVDFNNGPVMGTQAYASRPALPVTAPAAPTNDKLTVDGKAATPAAYKINNANYFKLRDVAMLVNNTKAQFSIDYSDGNIYIVTGQPYQPIGGELSTVPSSSATAMTSNDSVYINGVKTDFTAYKIGGANYYGIRALGEALGFNVGWKSGVGMYIETDKPYTDAD